MTNALHNLSNGLAAAVETSGKSVVRVDARPRLPASGTVWADGVVVTAHHVVEVEDDITLGLPDGQTVAATLVGRDPTTDLAVLRTEATGLVAPAFADPADVCVGHLVLALGRPDDGIMASMGSIYGMSGEWRTPAGGQVDRFVQTDVTMYPGFSGGPLVDVAGRLIGINTSGLLRRMDAVVPVPTVRRVVEMLLAHGRVRRGYLGIGAQPVRLPAALAQSLGQEIGLLIISVEADSPADRNGLLLGDVIVGIGGQTIHEMDDLLNALSGDRIGTPVAVRLVRGGVVKEIPVVVGERAE